MDRELRFVVFLGLFAAASAVAMLLSVRRRPWAGRLQQLGLGRSASVCAECGYSLEGLVSGGVCPECGTGSEDRVPRRLVVDPVRVQRWWVVAGVSFMTCWVLEPAAHFGLIRAYARDGFDAERAGRWIPLREFARSSELFTPPMQLMWPLMLAVTVGFPLCILLPRRWWWRVMVVVWPVAFVGSVWRIAAYC